jgi:hypothetical protein
VITPPEPPDPDLLEAYPPTIIDTQTASPKLEAFFDYNERLSATLRRFWRTHQMTLDPDGVTHFQKVVLVAIAKAYKTHRCILLLCGQGYAEDAEILLRALFELAVSVRWVKLDPTGQRAERWDDSSIITRYRFLQVAGEGDPYLQDVARYLQGNPERVRQIEQTVRTMQAKWGFWDTRKDGSLGRLRHWSGRKYGLADLARDVGWESAYDTL